MSSFHTSLRFYYKRSRTERGMKPPVSVLSLLVIVCLSEAIPVKIQGILTNSQGKPIAGAHMVLAKAPEMETTSESDGYFGLYGDIALASMRKPLQPARKQSPIVQGQSLCFRDIAPNQSINVTIFNLHGKVITRIKQNGPKVILPTTQTLAAGRYFFRADIERADVVRGILCLLDGKYLINSTSVYATNAKQHTAVLASSEISNSYVIDTLVITAGSFRTTRIPLTSYQFIVKALSIDSAADNIFTIPDALSRDQFKLLAQSYYESNYSMLNSEEKTEVDKYKLFLDSPDSSLQFSYANQLMTASLLLETGKKGGYLSMCGVSSAAAAAPYDAAITNNFGAFLIGNKKYLDAIKVLEYSLKLRSDAPLIRTNLATAFLELGQDSLAEVHLREALRVNPAYSYANEGMALLMYKRRDFAQALKYMLKNGQAFVSTGLKPLFKEATGQIGMKLPTTPLPPNFQAPSETNPSGSLSRPLTKFVMPPYPKWDSPVRLAQASTLINTYSNKTFGKSMEILSNMLKMPDRINALNQLARERFVRNSFRYSGAQFGLECLMEYFDDRHKDVDDKYSIQYKKASEKHLTYLEQVMPGITQRMKDVCNVEDLPENADAQAVAEYMKQALVCLEGSSDLMQEMCKKIKVSNETYFLEWNSIARNHYYEDKRLCEEFWVMSEQYLNMTYENDLFYEMMEMTRRHHVLTKMGVHPVVWSLTSLSQIGPLSFYGCAQEKIPEEQEETAEECSADSAAPPPCPLPSNGIGGSIWIVSARVSCDDVEITVGQGVQVTFAENFKTRERTYSIGAGVDAKLGFDVYGGDVSGELKAEIGATFSATVDKNGNLVDLGAGVNAGMGLSMLGNEVGTFASARSTVRAGFSSELVAKASAGGYTYFNGTY